VLANSALKADIKKRLPDKGFGAMVERKKYRPEKSPPRPSIFKKIALSADPEYAKEYSSGACSERMIFFLRMTVP
jgi:hypothetical protein